jgi:hypothetical protein
LLGAGFFGGIALGGIARAFMRLFSDDPEFSWSGTLFIVGLFAVFGTVQALVAVVRRASRTRLVTTSTRALGGFTVFLLGLGPGMMMLPALWCAPLAYWHRSWRSAVRRTLIGVALVDAGVLVVLALATAGMDPGTLAGVVLFIGVYVTITWVAGATLAPHERVLADVGR